jgi:hypothetical protein
MKAFFGAIGAIIVIGGLGFGFVIGIINVVHYAEGKFTEEKSHCKSCSNCQVEQVEQVEQGD